MQLWRSASLHRFAVVEVTGVEKTQIDTVRVFTKWLASVEGCDPDLPAKIKSPSLSAEENSRSVELHTDEAENVLTYLEKYEYASLRHVTLTLLWHTMMRRGRR